MLEALDHVSRMEYAAAESLLIRIPENVPARPYFLGIVHLNRFQDLGDTTALRHAELSWERLSLHADNPERYKGEVSQLHTYQGLATMQLSYVSALRGSRLHSASQALTAHDQLLRLHGMAEADAGLAVFDYYREHLLESIRFIPFMHPNSELPLKRLEIAADSSRYLRDVLRASAFWMRVDRGEIDSALKIPDDFLRRYPRNRLARQMKGSALYRLGKLSEARKIYEDLLKEYALLRDSLPPGLLPLGYMSSVGNLIRIYSALNMKTETASKMEEWHKARNSKLDPWLPGSLKKDIEQLKKS